MSISALSDPATLATFERACAAVLARGSGITLKELATASALAEALVAGNHVRLRDMAIRLKVSPSTLTASGRAGDRPEAHGNHGGSGASLQGVSFAPSGSDPGARTASCDRTASAQIPLL